VLSLHCPCPPEHGVGDDQAPDAAKLTLESRSYPVLVYDPAEGYTMAERLSLDGNPSIDDTWPTYDLKYVDQDGQEQVMELPVTTADWAATEARFKKHFKRIRDDVDDDSLMPFHEFLTAAAEDRDGMTPFIYMLRPDRTLGRVAVSSEMVELAEDRLHVWSLLKEMAGLAVDVSAEAEHEFEAQAAQIKAEYEAQIADLKQRYPQLVARRLAEGLVRAGNGQRTIADLLSEVQAMPIQPLTLDMGGLTLDSAPSAPTSAVPMAQSVTIAPAATAVVEEEEGLALEPYIDTVRCTSCEECIKVNKKMFAYDDKKQAYIKDAKAGTFKELVTAAERCPVRIIHPGTPLNPKEKDLDKWVNRAEPFN
jgi:pyruvate-ferredoxin/flavodoxin oxidoreductase